MNWNRTVTKEGATRSESGSMEDPYWQLAAAAKATGYPTARISSTVVHGIEYGEIKCSFTVSIECVQSKETMDGAALLAFRAAVEYTNSGMSYLAPELPQLATP
jgi:hypothetical protein